jgi:F420-dependent oxidoreductase-like protein
MRICLMIEGQEGVSWEQWLALARACEDAGLEGLFRSDHYTSISAAGERGSLDAWATLAGLAANTERIRLGTMVSPATFRHPSTLAREATTVDHISGGRVELGLGAGWYELEHTANGFPFPGLDTRLEIFAEQLEIVHRQWTEDVFDFAGHHYQLSDCRALPKPVQQPKPPLVVGGIALAGTVGPAVRFADEYNTFFASAETCRARRGRIVEACERAGRDPATLAFSLMATCIVARDREQLLEKAGKVMRLTGSEHGHPTAFLADTSDGRIVGTVDEVAEHLHALEEAGVERVMLQHLDHEDLDTVELIGAELLPRVGG